MIVVVDAGNTRAKWKAWSGAAVIERGEFDTTDPSAFIAWLSEQSVSQLVLAEVGRGRLQAQLQGALSVSVQEVHSSANLLGVTNCYDEPERLGIDRFLAAIEAWYLADGEAACVLDLGTAATLDVVNAEGRHCGGYIVPGLALLRSSLLQSTQKVHFEASAELDEVYGVSTAEAVNNGTWCMLKSWVLAESEKFYAQYPQGRLFLTGGGMSAMRPYLPENVTCHQDLVLDALWRLALQQK